MVQKSRCEQAANIMVKRVGQEVGVPFSRFDSHADIHQVGVLAVCTHILKFDLLQDWKNTDINMLRLAPCPRTYVL